MKINLLALVLKTILILSFTLVSSCAPQSEIYKSTEQAVVAELNPFDPDINSILESMDKQYFEQTGENPFDSLTKINISSNCKRINCKVFALVRKSEQKLYLYVDQQLITTWLVSTGDADHETPLLSLHPNGRIYDKYSSSKYPGGDYNGLGNMPYAVFLYNGFAIHGTPKGNWKNLGKKASHGCIRSHPDHAMMFNRLVRQHGINNVWFQITN
jgi:lipoprotein-anchoring transpeptidase ErfK/SrfK